MHGPDALPPADPRLESPHAAQLRRGFPRLRFDSALESEFRKDYRARILPQVRRNLWLAMAFVVGFAWLTHGILDRQSNAVMDMIRLALFAPLLVLGQVVAYSSRLARFFPVICQVGAALFGMGVAVLAVIAAQNGASLISSAVVVTIYIYLMLGMMFYEALAVGLLIFLGYLVAAAIGDVPPALMRTDSGILVIGNVIGAMVCYSLERANRTNFLESRLLIETASRDGLSGIYNRRYFDDHLAQAWAKASREPVALALLLIDIDHFKAYNDHYGHQAGDDCLKRVARCLERCARRPLDIAARYGGEEFAVILFDTHPDHVRELAQRIRSEIAALAITHCASPSRRLTVSIGAACVDPAPTRSPLGLVQLADEALYGAKARGRDCVVLLDNTEYDGLITGTFRRTAKTASA